MESNFWRDFFIVFQFASQTPMTDVWRRISKYVWVKEAI
jgi:hypothetical protein